MTNSTKAWAPKPEKERVQNTAYKMTGNGKAAPKGFMEKMEEVSHAIYDLTLTENGAVAYSTSGSALVDMNFAVASLRGKSATEITKKFRKAFNEEPINAMRWLMWCRDVREGLGERNILRVCLHDLAKNGMSALVNLLVPHIAEMGRWDDLWCLLDTPCKATVYGLVKSQLDEDVARTKENQTISLLAKWLPSENTSSSATRDTAKKIRNSLKLTPRDYRKTLSALRKHLDVVERKMSSDNWQAIDYEAVPSKANLLYNGAFLKHDEERRRAYLGALEKGEAKINSSVAFPHDIVHAYTKKGLSRYTRYTSKIEVDPALEAMWKSQKDLVNGEDSTIVVADGSGSMTVGVGNSGVQALEVANALAIYFAERCKGEFANKYITFSEHPQFVKLNASTLAGNLVEAYKHDEVANTNIEAVFDLLLATVTSGKATVDEMPKTVLILSDMEFDNAVCNNTGRYITPTCSLFNKIKAKYDAANVAMPRLVFWNLNSRSGAIPVTQHDTGVALVSGFSPNICRMVMSDKLDPREILLDTITVERYDFAEEAVKAVCGSAE